jgi:hypothetical protein
MANYVPSHCEQFLFWAKKLIGYAEANAGRMQIPNQAITPLRSLLSAYEQAFIKAKDPNRGKVDVQEKNRTRKELEKAIRAFVKTHINFNPAVTKAERENMGLPVYGTVRSPSPIPVSNPVLSVNTGISRRLSLRYKDKESGKRGKPKGVREIEVRWEIFDTSPSDIGELKNTALATSQPITLDFKESQRGKKVYMCGRWVSTRGNGPFGSITEAVIP